MMVPVLVALLAAPVPTPGQPTAPSNISGLPMRIVHDFGRLATRGPLITLGVGGVLAAATYPADQQAVRSLSRSASADAVLDAGATAGGGAVQIGGAIAVYAIGGLSHHGAVAEVGSALVEAQVVSGVLTQGIKFAVDRTRPDGGSYSFPSGHTSATFATAGVLQRRFGWKVGVPAYLGGVYVAAARVAERKHYLSDVVFGSAIGLASAQTIDIRTRYGRLTAGPIFLRGGAGVVFSLH